MVDFFELLLFVEAESHAMRKRRPSKVFAGNLVTVRLPGVIRSRSISKGNLSAVGGLASKVVASKVFAIAAVPKLMVIVVSLNATLVGQRDALRHLL